MSSIALDTPAASADEATAAREILRFLTCGSVDDGKSTLIGRMLFDSQLVLEDQLKALERDSRTSGTVPDGLDLALMLDGLEAEREQGITIDVAYRYFATAKRKFIVADTPGHEQYTRNMVTGASNADLAVILVDARKGLLPQTRRHSYIVSLLGIGHIVLAVNKMDLVDFDEARFAEIAESYMELADGLGVPEVTCIPVSALKGDNVVRPSNEMSWWQGPSLIGFLEGVAPPAPQAGRDFRMPVQWVNRPNADFRGYAGRIVAGNIAPGDEVTVMPSRRTSRAARIVTHDGDLESAGTGRSVTLMLDDEIDISRGDVLAGGSLPEVADQFAARLVWMHEDPMFAGRRYLLKSGTQTVPASITAIRNKVNIETYEEVVGRELALNDIGTCTIATDRPLVFEPYETGGELGAFILIDRLTNVTVGAGMITHAMRRATNISWQDLDIDRNARASAKAQRPCVLWFTGLSGAGKSTVANIVERKLHAQGRHTFLLDGDNVRHGLNNDLGFTAADRVENIRRVAETAKLMTDAGLIVLVSLISPFRHERRMARETMEDGEFLEIFVDTPLEVCEARDPKGLYRKARSGEIPNFTGIGSPYERPEQAEITVDSGTTAAEAAADEIIEDLRARGIV